MTQVTRIGDELERFAERLMVKLTLEVAANLKEETPIDTGWARANWLADISERGCTSPEMNSDPTPQEASAKSQEQSSREAVVAATYDLDRGPISVSNCVPYITVLNNGSSNQAPRGFVQKSIAKAVRTTTRG